LAALQLVAGFLLALG